MRGGGGGGVRVRLRLRLRARTRVKVEVECGVWRVRRGPLVAGARVGLIRCGVVSSLD